MGSIWIRQLEDWIRSEYPQRVEGSNAGPGAALRLRCLEGYHYECGCLGQSLVAIDMRTYSWGFDPAHRSRASSSAGSRFEVECVRNHGSEHCVHSGCGGRLSDCTSSGRCSGDGGIDRPRILPGLPEHVAALAHGGLDCNASMPRGNGHFRNCVGNCFAILRCCAGPSGHCATR